jgi:glucose-6-phosphate dehydrogenase assembly protein OpcA
MNGAATWEGKGVSLGKIDAELQRLWRAADSEWNGDGPRPDIRTSVLNLIVYAPDQACCDRTTAALEHLSGTHPSRAIIIVPGHARDSETGIDCRLSIHSHGAYAEFRQVCSEQLVLWVHGQASQHLASIVMPLLAPDLPVFLWWPGETPFHHHVYGQLRDVADRFVVDSSDFAHPAQDLVAMSHSVHAAGQKTAFSDFNWARLAPWRELVASFFDAPQLRPYLERLQGIEIECAPVRDRSVLDLPQALLLAGWVASSLGLRADARQVADKKYSLHLANGTHGVGVEIVVADESSSNPVSVQLKADGKDEEPPVELTLSMDRQTGQVHAAATLAGGTPIVRKTTMVDREEGHLLFEELEVFGHDTQYENALHAASTMLDPNYHRELVKGSLLV